MFLLFAVTLMAVIAFFEDPVIIKQKILNRMGSSEKKKNSSPNMFISFLLSPLSFFYRNNVTSQRSSLSLDGAGLHSGTYGAIPVQEEVICIELGDVLERGDNLGIEDDLGCELVELPDRKKFSPLKSSFSPSNSLKEEVEEESEYGSKSTMQSSSSVGSLSPKIAVSPTVSTAASAANLYATSSPALHSQKMRRESSKGQELEEGSSTSSSVRMGSSLANSRTASRRGSGETIDSGRDTLSALDVRTNGNGKLKSRVDIQGVSNSAGVGGDNGYEYGNYHSEEGRSLYDASSEMSSSGQFTMAGMGGTYTYNYNNRDIEDGDDGCWMCCNLFGAEVAVILFIYLINKTGQEMIVSSVPCLSSQIFGWDSQRAGFFMATMGVRK